MTATPWSDPEHNVLGDLQEFYRIEYAKFRPDLAEADEHARRAAIAAHPPFAT